MLHYLINERPPKFTVGRCQTVQTFDSVDQKWTRALACCIPYHLLGKAYMVVLGQEGVFIFLKTLLVYSWVNTSTTVPRQHTSISLSTERVLTTPHTNARHYILHPPFNVNSTGVVMMLCLAWPANRSFFHLKQWKYSYQPVYTIPHLRYKLSNAQSQNCFVQVCRVKANS